MILTDGIHLAAADLNELHEFAASIGLPRRWFHAHQRHPHYDLLTAEARSRALAAGAKLVRSREIVLLLKANFEGEAGRRWLKAFPDISARSGAAAIREFSMFLYAVTVSIDLEVHDEWSEWMRTVHIPDVMATGLFRAARMLQVSEPSTAGRVTYRFEYELPDQATYDKYQSEHAPRLQADHTERFAGRFEASRSLAQLQAEW